MKTVRLKMSDRCFRFKPDALFSHAPASPGVYEFVTFDSAQNPKVVFVGLALERSIRDCLQEHLDGTRKPAGSELFSRYPNLYFDYVERASIGSPEEWGPVAEALRHKHKPELNEANPAESPVELREVEIL